MAKPLVFRHGGKDVAFEMGKIDRAKLYGYKETEILDEDGDKCEMATLCEDGHTVVGRGGTGQGYLTADGRWSNKADLNPVDHNGQSITPVPSSFASAVVLGEPTTTADYLAHMIRSVYLMNCADADHPLVAELKAGAIFRFAYSFRGGLESDAAFLLCNSAQEIFMAVGSSTKIDFIGLQQTAGVIGNDSDAPDEEGDGDDMDFGMI